MIWGPNGSALIDKTTAVIDGAVRGRGQEMACDGSQVDFGEPSDWEHVSAEESEQVDGAWSML